MKEREGGRGGGVERSSQGWREGVKGTNQAEKEAVPGNGISHPSSSASPPLHVSSRSLILPRHQLSLLPISLRQDNVDDE